MAKNLSTAQLTGGGTFGYNQAMETELLYSPEDILRLEKKKRIWTAVLAVIAGGALIACVTLCLITRTANAAQMERAVIVLSGAAGCLCLYLRRFAVAETGHEIAHAEMLLRDESAEYDGVLTVTKERLRIRNSIAIRLVSLTEGGEVRRLKVIESRAKRLSAYEGRTVRLRVVNGYVAGVRAL